MSQQQTPAATENIPEIIDFIQVLIDKGYAYESDGDVYYRARKFKHYGELSDQPIDELEVGASQHVDDQEFDKKKKIQLILHYGKQPSQKKLIGNHHGALVGRDGISSVRSCRPSI